MYSMRYTMLSMSLNLSIFTIYLKKSNFFRVSIWSNQSHGHGMDNALVNKSIKYSNVSEKD